MKNKDDVNLFLSGDVKKCMGEKRNVSHGGLEKTKDVEIEDSCKQEGESSFPVSWLPAMVVPSEGHSGYVLEQNEKMGSEMIAPGTLVQLPSYPGSSGGKVYGIVVAPNTVVPLDTLSLVNMAGLNKAGHSGINESDVDMIGSVKGVRSKLDSPEEGGGESMNLDLSFGSGSAMNSVLKDHLFCVYCRKYFKNLAELQSHMISDHSDQQQQQQPVNSYFNDQTGIHASLKTCCPSCGHQLRRVPFESDFALGGHGDDYHSIALTQGGGILMICDNCDKEYTLGVASEPSQQTASQEASKRHFCEHCDKSYKHNRDLRKHLRMHHGVEVAIPTVPASISYQNETIVSSVQSSSFVPSVHTTKIVCQQCKKMFRGPFELRRHIHTVHENKRPYKCPDCNKFFRDAYELKRHSASHQRLHYHNLASAAPNTSGQSVGDMVQMQSNRDNSVRGPNVSHMVSNGMMQDVYSGQPTGQFTNPSNPQTYDYFCGPCDKNFRGANEFRRHYSVVHEKKYRYKCLHCGKLWRDQYDLKRHCRRSHFVDREIDRTFIKQCLLENNETSVQQGAAQIGGGAGYDLTNPQITLTLNREAAAAIFGQTDQDIRNSQSQMESTFSLLDHNNISISQTSPTGAMFSNIPSIQPPSMLYHGQDASHLVENMIQPQDSDAIQEETKNAVNWSNFESDIQVPPPP